jgi:hypothetical protein
MLQGYLFGIGFFLLICVLIGFIIHNCVKCRHEWEEHGIRVYCKHRQHTVDAYCLICKKCGKVKVIK